ncbi:MAG: hypothetical protein ACD_47C00067G0002 [uncultured bacterium]|nr:MAG: hypothetical protein ACD_47C00067G0002 [uncultured bacterium]
MTDSFSGLNNTFFMPLDSISFNTVSSESVVTKTTFGFFAIAGLPCIFLIVSKPFISGRLQSMNKTSKSCSFRASTALTPDSA